MNQANLKLRCATFFENTVTSSRLIFIALLGLTNLSHADNVLTYPTFGLTNNNQQLNGNLDSGIFNNTKSNGANSWSTKLATTDDGNGLIDKQHNLMLGEWALRQINENAPLINDPWLKQSLEQIVWQINAVAGLDAPLALAIINDKQINAFAVPSGLIGVNVGLLDKARSMDELASVLSHEIAHVSQRHYQHRNDEKTKQLLLQAGGMLAGIAAARSGDGNAGAAVMIGSQTMSANSAAAFSRSQEKEADRIGMQLMAQAGYDVNAMPNFFATLDQQNPIKPNSFIPSFVLSHPLTADRLSEARLRASSYRTNYSLVQQSVLNNNTQAYRKQLFDQMQWRGRYLAHLINKADLLQGALTSEGAKLALAEQYLDERQFGEAEKIMKSFELQITNFSNPLAVIISSKLDVQTGKPDTAIHKLTTLSTLFPERRDAKLNLADIYLSKSASPDNARKVLTLLQPLSQQYPKEVVVWQKLMQASQILVKTTSGDEKTLQQINVLRYRANSEFWQNQLQQSITSLAQAKKLATNLSNNKSLIAVINRQMQQVQQANNFRPS